MCEEYGIAVHLGGIFGGTTISPIFGPLPEHEETVAAWQALADKYSVSLGAVAIAFAALPACVSKVVVGMRSVADAERNAAQIAENVPPALWTEAQAQGLLRPELKLQPPGDDERSQIEACLAGLEREAIAKGGSGKSSILRVTFELSDLSLKPLLNEVWAGWMGEDALLPPARAVVGVGGKQEQLISASAEVAPTADGEPERHEPEPGLYSLATVIRPTPAGHQRAKVFVSGISAELALGDDAMPSADIEVQTNAVLDTIEQLLVRAFGSAGGLSKLTRVTVYMVSSDWLVEDGLVKAVLSQRGVSSDCAVLMVGVEDLGPSTLVEIVATAEVEEEELRANSRL